MKFYGNINREGTGIHFTKRQREKLLEKARPGDQIELYIRRPVNPKKRGFFEGAIVPAYAEWSEAHDAKDRGDLESIRTFFKVMFNPEYITGADGTVVTIPKSTKELSNDEFGENFLDKIQAYFMENYIPFPDPNLWYKWRDEIMMNRPPGEDYVDWLRDNNLNFDGSIRD